MDRLASQWTSRTFSRFEALSSHILLRHYVSDMQGCELSIATLGGFCS